MNRCQPSRTPGQPGPSRTAGASMRISFTTAMLAAFVCISFVGCSDPGAMLLDAARPDVRPDVASVDAAADAPMDASPPDAIPDVPPADLGTDLGTVLPDVQVPADVRPDVAPDVSLVDVTDVTVDSGADTVIIADVPVVDASATDVADVVTD